MLFYCTLAFSAVIAVASASNVVDLNPTNFDSVIGKGKPALVEFFAPWCGHCKNLAPIYEELADAFAQAKDKVVIAKVDADGEGKPLGQKYGVTGFPTLKWFDAQGKEEAYDGGRDLDTLADYITKKSGVKAKLAGPPPSDVAILDAHNFDQIALDSSKNVIVTFTAPWCGHCKRMKPHYEKVATTFLPESGCVVANVNADDQKNRDISQRYDVSGFPTIKFFPKDSQEPEEYEGGRTEEDFVAYLNEKCGTHRAVGGGFNDHAGRSVELDTLAQKFFSASTSAREALYLEAQELSTTAGSAAKHYIRVMDKLVNGSADYIEKESKRLEGILSKRNLAPSKLDEMKIKANVLKAFAAEKDTPKDTISREEAEL